MSEKRRDNKKRILRNGESQRPDGRYVYKYYDIMKKPHFPYSWKLEPTDKLPAGKRDDLSLREKIRQLQKDMMDGIDVQGSEMTVLELLKRYLATKTNAGTRILPMENDVYVCFQRILANRKPPVVEPAIDGPF